MATQPMFRTLSEYQSNTESFCTYVEHVKVCILCGKWCRRRQAVFLTVIRAKIFALLCNLTASTEPLYKTLVQVINVLGFGKHFKSKQPVTVEHFDFHQGHQKSPESVAEWYAELQWLSRTAILAITLTFAIVWCVACTTKHAKALVVHERSYVL